jgi:hypothetical protein
VGSDVANSLLLRPADVLHTTKGEMLEATGQQMLCGRSTRRRC